MISHAATLSAPAMPLTPPVPFYLPMMAVFSVTNHPDRTIAHALQFDLVAVGKTEEEAVHKLRTSVKYHVEFGIRHGYVYDILSSAPPEAWDALTTDSRLKIGEPIQIANGHLLTATRTIQDDEPQLSSRAA
jgi:hypothetical protein